MKNNIAFTLFILVFLFFAASSTFTQWQPDARLTNNTGISYTSYNRPCIAANGDVLHIVWHDNRDGNTEVYYKRSTDAGTTWGSDMRLTNNSANSEFPTIAVLGMNVYVVWQDGRDTTNEVYFNKSTDAGITWGPDTRITFAPGESNFPVIAVSGSALHVAWHDYRNGNTEIYYKQSTDAGASWSADVRMTVSTGVRGFPQLTISGPIVHLIWQDNRHGEGEIYYVRSSNSGVNWSTEVRLTNDSRISGYPTVTSSGSTVHLAWWDERSYPAEIYYKKSTDDGLNWGTDVRLTNSSGASYDPFIYASGTLVHIVWIDTRDGNFEIYYKESSDAGANWSNDYRITNNPGTSECNSMIANGPKVHVLWQDIRDGNYEIYYKQNPIGNTLGAVDSVSPFNKVSVPLNSDMKAYFNQNMNGLTFDSNSIILFGSMTGIKYASYTYNSGERSVLVSPQYDFKFGELISATLKSSIKTSSDNFIAPFVWCFTALTNPSNSVFNKYDTVIVGDGPAKITSGDFDGDDDLDLALTNEYSNIVSILKNNGAGVFIEANVTGVGSAPDGIVTGDLDSDGDLDLAVANESSNTVSILVNNGSGTFSVSSDVVVGHAGGIATGDIDSDGDLDLAVTRRSSNNISILKNNGTGTFSVSSNITATSPQGITAGDLDNDGDLDLGIVEYLASRVSIFKNDGTGIFALSSAYGAGTFTDQIVAGDFNNDGDLDLAVTCNSGSVSILENNGTGIFSVSNIAPSGARGITSGDFDGDGNLDLAVNNFALNTVSILKNNGTGTFNLSSTIGAGNYPIYITTGDFNNNGVLDLAVTNIYSSIITVLMNLTQPQLSSPANNSAGNLNALNFTWSKIPGASNYRIQISTDSVFNDLFVNDSTILGTDSVKNVSGLSPLTWYYWRMNSKSANGTSLWSDTWKFKTLGSPTQVNLFSPANNSVNQPVGVTFNWTKATDQLLNRINFDKEIGYNGPENVSKYWMELSTDSLFASINYIDSALADTTAFVSGLNNLTDYYWRVKAKNEIGWGNYSERFRFTTIISAPPAPVLVSPSNGLTGQNVTLTLTWNKLPTAVSYRVQLSSDSLFANLIVNDSVLTDSTRMVSGLNPLTFYWWRVNANNIGGTGVFSEVWKFKTIGYPSQVNLINPVNNALNQPVSINFRWSCSAELMSPFISAKMKGENFDGPDAVSKYCFEMVTDTVNMTNLLRDTTLSDTTKFVNGLINLTNYYWRVKAKGVLGWGYYCAWFKFTTIVSTPIAPVLFSPPDNSIGQNTSLTLVWNKAALAANYRVQLSSDSLFINLIVNDSTLTDSTRMVTGLNSLTYYWWRVCASNIGGTSAYSPAFKFKTMGVPGQVILLTPANNAVSQPLNLTCVWRRSFDQLAPELNRSKKERNGDNIESISNYWFDMVTDTSTMANLVRDTTLTDSTKSVNGLNYLTSYFWRVKAKNQIGWGSYSTWFKFTTMVLPPALVNLTVIPAGFFNPSSGQLNLRDTVKVYIIDSASCTRVDSAKVVIDSVTFSAMLSFSNIVTGNYYIYVLHRNHIIISSALRTTITRGSTVNYNFASDSSKTFGQIVTKVSSSPALWGMIPGDANCDGYTDGLDQSQWVSQNGFDGYLPADFNGDLFVDGLDQTIWVINNGQCYYLPCELSFENPVDHQIKVKAINNKQIESIFRHDKDNR